MYVDAEGCKAAVGSGKSLMDGSFDKTIVVAGRCKLDPGLKAPPGFKV